MEDLFRAHEVRQTASVMFTKECPMALYIDRLKLMRVISRHIKDLRSAIHLDEDSVPMIKEEIEMAEQFFNWAAGSTKSCVYIAMYPNEDTC